MKEIESSYRPRPIQSELHQKIRRFSAVAMHRRAGKSIMAINHTIDAGLRCRFPNPQYGFVSPLLSQSKRNLWDPLKKFTKHFPQLDINESELRVDIWRMKDDRVRIQLFGAENPDSLAGFYMDGVFMDEAQDHAPEFFGKTVLPMLTDRKGWALFMGTVRGRNYFWKLRQRYREKMLAGDPDYFEAELPASKTGLISQVDLDRAKEEMGEEYFMQEFELSVESSNKGSYYGTYFKNAEKENRITTVPYEPALQVDTAWDLGMDDTTAIWFFQMLGKEIRIIDYMEDSGLGIPEWAGRLREKPYSYGTMYLPHDAAVREMGTGRSREEVFRSQKFRTEIVKRQAIADGIQAVRLLLPRCWFDKSKCEKGIDSLKAYQRAWNEKEQVFNDHPCHDWSSHASDAFRTLAMGIKKEAVDIRPDEREAEIDYSIFG